MPSYGGRLTALQKTIGAFRSDPEDDASGTDAEFISLLKEVVAVVREAEAASAPYLSDIIDVAGNILDDAVHCAYHDEDYGRFDFLPSYAHSSDMPLVEDPMNQYALGGSKQAFLKIFNSMLGEFCNGRTPTIKDVARLFPPSWRSSPRIHPKSTRLSRFRDGVNISATDATPHARNILQARCEVSADDIICPIGAAISADSSILAVIGSCGWKSRDPSLALHFLGGVSDDNDDRIECHNDHYSTLTIDPGFNEVARAITMDNSHKLAVVADSDRIKTFFWGRAGDITFDGWTPGGGQNVHTLKSGNYNGPLAVLPGGRIARAGKGGIAIWDVKTLATHQGGKLVGEGKLNIEDSWRDDCEEKVERSTGSKPSSEIRFGLGDEEFAPLSWELHEPSGHMLAADNAQQNSGRYGCYALDLEHNGKKVTRFLGHGGEVDAFSTSPGDANVFVTGCSDGYARLFDVRHPLPVMTLDSGGKGEGCEVVSFIHPDGVPIVFTGGPRSASVKAWDIRACANTYELATGNTAVRALSWDAQRNTLYAAAECTYMGRNGEHYGYRRAKIPRWAREFPEETEPGMDVDKDEEDEDEEGEDEEDDYDEHNWPEKALRQETYYGYAYDAGENVLLRYGFKEEPDLREVPAYGQAQLESNSYW